MFDPSDSLLAAELHQVVIVYPVALTQPEKNQLVTSLDVAELFHEIAGRAIDVAVDVTRVREAPLADERVSAETEAVVLLPPPVTQVVARLLARARKVADLVLRESRIAKYRHHLDVEIRD